MENFKPLSSPADIWTIELRSVCQEHMLAGPFDSKTPVPVSASDYVLCINDAQKWFLLLRRYR
jgi:hypothetical protein